MTLEEYVTQWNFSYFRGDCGHEWVSPGHGSWACPYCGRYDGNGHLVIHEEIDLRKLSTEVMLKSIAAYYELAGAGA